MKHNERNEQKHQTETESQREIDGNCYVFYE